MKSESAADGGRSEGVLSLVLLLEMYHITGQYDLDAH